jgi:hypothetical protein
MWPDDGLAAMQMPIGDLKGKEKIAVSRRRKALLDLHDLLIPKDEDEPDGKS